MTNKIRNVWCFHSSKRKSLQIRIDFKGERAPPPEQRVFFNSPAQKNLGKRYPTQWRDWNRSGSNSLAWNNSRINNYNGAFLSRRNYDSILRRQYVPAEILAVVFMCNRREISMYVAREKNVTAIIPTKRKNIFLLSYDNATHFCENWSFNHCCTQRFIAITMRAHTIVINIWKTEKIKKRCRKFREKI